MSGEYDSRRNVQERGGYNCGQYAQKRSAESMVHLLFGRAGTERRLLQPIQCTAKLSKT